MSGLSQLSFSFLLPMTKKLICYIQSKGKIVKKLNCKAIAHVLSALRSCVVKDKSFTRNLSNQKPFSLGELAILILSFIIFHVETEEKRDKDKKSHNMNCKLMRERHKIEITFVCSIFQKLSGLFYF